MKNTKRNDCTRTIPEKESLTVEFKSDSKSLSDDDLVEAITCMANSQGGELYLGMEDDGTVTGLQPKHLDTVGIVALIENKTVPPLHTRAYLLDFNKIQYMKIEIPKANTIVSTTKGMTVRRRLKIDGTPECTPFFPHEFTQRESDLGLLDFSSHVLHEADINDLDVFEVLHLRKVIQRNSNESYLITLQDEELLKALDLVKEQGSTLKPTLTGLLLIGKEESIRRFIPTHEVAFQVLKEHRVVINQYFRSSLLKIIEKVEDLFTSRITEDEMQIGLARQAVPNYDLSAFREAFINAIVHRDFSRMGTVLVQIDDYGMTITNPGGFMEGVNLQNLIHIQPMPRNRSLVDTIKRIGFTERTGRGIDLIFYGQLRYGRPIPDYSDSTNHQVTVFLSSQKPDFSFIERIQTIEKSGNARLTLDELLILNWLFHEKHADMQTLATVIQRNPIQTNSIVLHMMEEHILQAKGSAKNTRYILHSNLLVNQPKFHYLLPSDEQNNKVTEQMIVQYLSDPDRQFTRKEMAELLQTSLNETSYILKKLVREGKLLLIKKGPKSYYKTPV
ncbi:putative DNA binding domain-containing protein [bacterium]|nr:putative DNA binding domain-containing protein [bacterium]